MLESTSSKVPCLLSSIGWCPTVVGAAFHSLRCCTGDADSVITEAIDTCPVNCIHYVPWQELKSLEVMSLLLGFTALWFLQWVPANYF